MRGAAAALVLGQTDAALRLLEEGRAQQMGARLREAEARLDAQDRVQLDTARSVLAQAEIAATRAQEIFAEAHLRVEAAQSPGEREHFGQRREASRQARDAAGEAVAAAHAAITGIKTEIGLDDTVVPLPDATALRHALGTAALVQMVPGRAGGWLLLLAPEFTGWRVLPVAGLTAAAVAATTTDYLDQLSRFETARPQEEDDAGRHDLPVNAFSRALDERLGRRDGEIAGIWDLVAGPLHAALAAAGLAPAACADLASEVVLCLPAELAMLPLSAARDPATGRAFFHDYALRFVPSLGMLISAASRAVRDTPRSAVTITDPLGDLTFVDSPASGLFDPQDLTVLTGYARAADDGGVATWAGFAGAVEQRRPGYIAYFGHSHWDKRNAEASGICLAAPRDAEGRVPQDTNGQTGTDLATPPRLRSLDLAATRLVFSASCGGAGLGLGVARDEMVGLPSAWLEAGAAALISSLYTVYTGPAADMMRLVLQQVLGQWLLVHPRAGALPPVQALRRAQITLERAFADPAILTYALLPVPPEHQTAVTPIPTVILDGNRSHGTDGQTPARAPANPSTANPFTTAPSTASYLATFHPTAQIAAFVIFGA